MAITELRLPSEDNLTDIYCANYSCTASSQRICNNGTLCVCVHGNRRYEGQCSESADAALLMYGVSLLLVVFLILVVLYLFYRCHPTPESLASHQLPSSLRSNRSMTRLASLRLDSFRRSLRPRESSDDAPKYDAPPPYDSIFTTQASLGGCKVPSYEESQQMADAASLSTTVSTQSNSSTSIRSAYINQGYEPQDLQVPPERAEIVIVARAAATDC